MARFNVGDEVVRIGNANHFTNGKFYKIHAINPDGRLIFTDDNGNSRARPEDEFSPTNITPGDPDDADQSALALVRFIVSEANEIGGPVSLNLSGGSEREIVRRARAILSNLGE